MAPGTTCYSVFLFLLTFDPFVTLVPLILQCQLVVLLLFRDPNEQMDYSAYYSIVITLAPKSLILFYRIIYKKAYRYILENHPS